MDYRQFVKKFCTPTKKIDLHYRTRKTLKGFCGLGLCFVGFSVVVLKIPGVRGDIKVLVCNPPSAERQRSDKSKNICSVFLH